MTINVYGVDPSIDEARWAQLHADAMDGLRKEFVAAGLIVTAKAASTRTVTISAGRSVQAGTLAVSDAATDFVVPAASSGSPQIQLVCLEVDWSKSSALAGRFMAVTGSPGATPVAPNSTKTPGTLWQIPLARVRLPSSATAQLTAAMITPAAPVASEKVWSTTVIVSDGGDYPSNQAVTYPLGMFTTAPRVQLTAITGAGASTISNLDVGSLTADGCTVSIARSTVTNVTVCVTATGT